MTATPDRHDPDARVSEHRCLRCHAVIRTGQPYVQDGHHRYHPSCGHVRPRPPTR